MNNYYSQILIGAGLMKIGQHTLFTIAVICLLGGCVYGGHDGVAKNGTFKKYCSDMCIERSADGSSCVRFVEGTRNGCRKFLERDYTELTVWYATDRKPEEEDFISFGALRGAVSYGTVSVSIPSGHQIGELESPSWWKFEFSSDPSEHVTLIKEETKNLGKARFFESIRSMMKRATAREAFVFIHGFNVSFEDAARRTAQIAYDLNFQGVPILYSWPSNGKLLSYVADLDNAKWTVPHLSEFLAEIATTRSIVKVHLIAHSMGNRPLIEALSRNFNLAENTQPSFNQILLTAPDIDADVFREFATRFVHMGENVTLYASENDAALNLSKKLRGGYARAGDSSGDVLVIPGIDTVDASAVSTDLLGHSYFGDSRSVLSDVFELFRTGAEPDQRFGLNPQFTQGGRFWVFQP